MSYLEDLQQAVIDGDANQAKSLTNAAIQAGSDPQDLLQKALIPAMAIVGEKMKAQEYYVPEVLVAARSDYFDAALAQPHNCHVKSTAAQVIDGDDLLLL